MMRIAFVLVALVAAASAVPFCPPTATVPELDLVPYMGRWYEIATSAIVRDTFERGLVCVSANYTLVGDIVLVNNSGYYGSPSGELTYALGKADVPDPAVPGALEVTFSGSFTGRANYFVMNVDYDDHVLIGGPCQEYLWILSRTEDMDDDTYNYLCDVAVSEGYNLERIGFKRHENTGC